MLDGSSLLLHLAIMGLDIISLDNYQTWHLCSTIVKALYYAVWATNSHLGSIVLLVNSGNIQLTPTHYFTCTLVMKFIPCPALSIYLSKDDIKMIYQDSIKSLGTLEALISHVPVLYFVTPSSGIQHCLDQIVTQIMHNMGERPE